MTDVAIKATKDVDRAHPELSGKEREDAIQAQVNKSEWGVGGDKRRIVESGTALIQGLVNGDVNKAVANASAPYIANQIAQHIPAENKEGRIAAHGIANVALALAKGENAGAQSLGAMTAEAVGMLSQELYKKKPSELTEDEKSTVSAFASLAAGIAGGLVGGDTSSAANAAEAGKTTVENNYLSDSEHRQKTSLELKEKQGKITEVEQQKLAELRIKDTETTQRLLDTCAGGVSPECTAARKDAFETIDTYVSLTYQNPKTAQAGYQEIERLLNSTSPEAQQAYNLLESYTEAFKNFGYTDEEARTRAGVYVGSIYIFGGMSAIANSGALVKQFGKDVAKPNVVPPKGNQVIDGSNTTKPGVTSPKDSNIIANKNQLPDWVNDIKTPNSRHNFNSINQKTTTKELNTVIDNSVDVAKDMAAIKNGEASIKGNTITVNNRTYERKESGVLYPVSGAGFTTLTRAEFKALGVYKQFGDTQKARDILTNMNTSSEAKIKALDTWKRNQK